MNFPKLHNNNLGSIKRFVFAYEDDILQWPDVINHTMTDVPTLKPGKQWYEGYSTIDARGFSEPISRDPKGNLYTPVLQGLYPRINNQITAVFELLIHKRMIVIVEDNNGDRRVIGRPGNAARFTYNAATGNKADNRNSYNYQFTLNSRFPSPHIGMIPDITISCLPAEYSVKDQNNNVLASGSIASGGFEPIDVTVPQVLAITTRVLTGQDFAEWTATADEVGNVTNIVTTVLGLVVKRNATVVTTPFAIAINDVIRFEFTALVANNTIKLEGSY
jgi:hypothetical protein